jgi:hypothetical protein
VRAGLLARLRVLLLLLLLLLLRCGVVVAARVVSPGEGGAGEAGDRDHCDCSGDRRSKFLHVSTP